MYPSLLRDNLEHSTQHNWRVNRNNPPRNPSGSSTLWRTVEEEEDCAASREAGTGGMSNAVFFCLFILAFDLYRSWRRTFCPVSLSAVRAVAARCKLPFALRPGLSQERADVPKEIDKGKNQRKARPVPYPSPADAMNEGVGRNSGSSSPSPISSTAPSASASPSRSSCRSRRSRSSHSDASLPTPSSSFSGGTSLPTPVEERKSSTACPHLSSVSRSRTVHLLFHLSPSAPPPTEFSAAPSIPGTP